MSIYYTSGESLDVPYNISGEAIENTDNPQLYSYDGDIIWTLNEEGLRLNAISNLSRWLDEQGTYFRGNYMYAKERYRMDTWSWVDGATAIGCAQVAYSWMLMWQYTKDSKYLTEARQLIAGLIAGRTNDGGYQMYVYNEEASYQTDKYTGGNSEVPLNLFRIAEIDTVNADDYIREALVSTDYLISMQQSDGSWRTSVNEAPKGAMFTSQAIGAIATGYKYTTRKEAYRQSILNGLNYIYTQLLSDGRIRATSEPDLWSEKWRPPTSDQSIVIRGLAIVELEMDGVIDTAPIHSFRQQLLPYLNSCIGDEGSVRNGLGTSTLLNDIYGITDHVYTTAFAIEGYHFSSVADNSSEEIAIRDGIIKFCTTNLYHSKRPATNGVIRGAYNVRDNNWDTSVLYQDDSNEGGADQIYVGWVMGPILSWLLRKQMEIENSNS